jgi:hypothetical protein
MSSPSNEKILNALLTIFNENTLQPMSTQVIDSLQALITENLQNTKILSFIFQQIQNQLLNLKGPQKKDVISLIPYIVKTSPKQLYTFTDKIIALYQSSISEDTSKIFTFISKNFGETSKILINSSNNNSYLLTPTPDNNENTLSNELTNVYNQFKQFCMNNVKNHNRYNQICGTLCLTAFIENCTYNYTNKDNLKSIWETLIYQITNNTFYAKLELLNCLISIIFSSEERFRPFASMTLYKIFDYITDDDWLKRKLALNIVYTLVYYCGEEIKPLKGYISKFLSERSADQVEEVRDVCLQILKLLGDGEASNTNANDSGFYSDRSSFSQQSNKGSQKKLNVMKKVNSKPNTSSSSALRKKKSDGSGSMRSHISSSVRQKDSSNMINSNNNNIQKNKSTIETIRENFDNRAKTPSSSIPKKSDSHGERCSSAKGSRKYYSISSGSLGNYANRSAQKEKSNLHNNFHITNGNNTDRLSSLRKTNQAQSHSMISSLDNIHNKQMRMSHNNSKGKYNNSKIKINSSKKNISKTNLSKNPSGIGSMSSSYCNYNTISVDHSKGSKNRTNIYNMKSSKPKVTVKPNQDNLNPSKQSNLISLKPEIVDELTKAHEDQSRIIVELQTNIKELEMKYKDNTQMKLIQLKKELNDYLINANYEEAFKTAVELKSIKKINYVIKHFFINYKQNINAEITRDTLKSVLVIFVNDLLKCENISLICCFIKENIIDKKYTFEQELHKQIIDECNKILSKKDKLFMTKEEIDYLLSFVKYFKGKN